MKLSNFPYLVQKEILDHFSINNLFFLSLCSKNTKNFIIHLQKYQFQKIERVNYLLGDDQDKITVKTVSRKKCDLLMRLFRTPAEFAEVMPFFRDSDLVEEIRVNVFGTSMDFLRSRTYGSDLHAKYCSDSLESVFETIQKYLYEILGHHTKSWMVSRSETTVRLPMVQNIQLLELFGGMVKSEQIDGILSKTACFESLSTFADHERQNGLRGNWKVYELDTVYVSTNSLATDFLNHFNGRHLFFHEVFILSLDAVRFLNAWKSRKKFRNLEVMSMDCSFDIPEIRSCVELKQVNTEVEYSFVRKFQERGTRLSLILPWEFRTNLYMVRESDGHVASVMLTPVRIFMGVWNLTETQFLERFQ